MVATDWEAEDGVPDMRKAVNDSTNDKSCESATVQTGGKKPAQRTLVLNRKHACPLLETLHEEDAHYWPKRVLCEY